MLTQDELVEQILLWGRAHGGKVDARPLAEWLARPGVGDQDWRVLNRRITGILGKRHGCLHLAQGLFKLGPKDLAG